MKVFPNWKDWISKKFVACGIQPFLEYFDCINGDKMFRRIGKTKALFCLALLCSAGVYSQVFPNNPIKLIVPYAAGGPTDIEARYLAEDLTKSLGQPVIVDNRAGASGMIGTKAVMRSAADGYTLLYTSLTHTITPLLIKSAGYDPVSDFTPVALIGNGPSALVMGTTQSYKSVDDLVRAAQNKKSVNFGSAGVGGSGHLIGELLNVQTGQHMLHVPYKGNGPAVTDVMSGQLTFMFYPLSHLKEAAATKKLQVLGVTSAVRHAAYPEVPTMKELGYSGFESANPWVGVLAPAHTPPSVVAILNKHINQSVTNGAIKRRSEMSGLHLTPGTSGDFENFLKEDKFRWKKVLDGAKIIPE